MGVAQVELAERSVTDCYSLAALDADDRKQEVAV